MRFGFGTGIGIDTAIYHRIRGKTNIEQQLYLIGLTQTPPALPSIRGGEHTKIFPPPLI